MEQNNYQGKLQKPIDSGFDQTTSATDVMMGVDLTGEIAIVTGGYSGLGVAVTKALTSAGATVIVPARDTEKAKANLVGISHVEVVPLDLMNPTSIDAFAEKFILY